MHTKNFHKQDTVQQLFKAILSLQTKEECMRLFDDLCTVKEINAFLQRLEIARLLRNGETYMSVQIETNASSTAITRIKKQLENGNGGFSLVLDRIDGTSR